MPSGQTQTQLSRRQLLALTPLMALAACGGRRATGFPGYALVTISGENCLAIVDLNTFHLLGRHQFHSAPSAVVAGKNVAYVLTPANGTVHAMDPDRNSPGRSARLGSELDFIRLTPQEHRIIAISSRGRELVIADTANLAAIRRARLSVSAVDLDLATHTTSQRNYVAISGGSSGIVERVDIDNGASRKRELPAELGVLRFRDDGELLFVANISGQSLIVLQADTLETVCELSLPMKPQNLAFGADNGQLFISGPGMDGVSIVYVYRTIEVDQTVLAAREPGPMVCSDNPRYLFVASRTGSEITILDIDSRKMVALSLAGDKPSRILITPDQQYALVLNEGSGSLAILRIPDIQENRTRNGAASLPSGIKTLRGISIFAMIPVGAQPSDVAIMNQRAS